MPPLRILHVSCYYERAWAYGGIPRAVSALARGQAKLGLEVTVCTTDVCSRQERIPAGRTAGARSREPEVHVFRNLSNRLAYDAQFFVPLGLGGFLRRHADRFDVAHLHGVHNLPGVAASHALRRAGVPYVLSPHGTAPRIEHRRLAKWLFDTTIGRHVIPGAAALVAVSDAERRQLAEVDGRGHRIHVVPNAIDLAEFATRPDGTGFRRRVGLGEGPLVVFLGKLTAFKRVDLLLAALATLPKNVSLLVAGNDMGAGTRLQEIVQRMDLAGRVTFTGLLRGTERLEALAAADVVAYPGQGEIFGLVAVEAILSGTPVVVADDSGCGEVVQRVRGGLTFPAGSQAGLASALQLVLESASAWRKAASDAAVEARRRFAAETVARQTVDVYRGVLEGESTVSAAAGSAEGGAWTADRG